MKNLNRWGKKWDMEEKNDGLEKIKNAKNTTELEEIRKELTGKNSELTSVLKNMSTLDQTKNCDNLRIESVIRSERERNLHLVRNIDNIRKQIPLKVGNSTISIL